MRVLAAVTVTDAAQARRTLHQLGIEIPGGAASGMDLRRNLTCGGRDRSWTIADSPCV